MAGDWISDRIAACKKSKRQLALVDTVRTTTCVPGATLDAMRRRAEIGDVVSAQVLTGGCAKPSSVVVNWPPAEDSDVPRYRLCVYWHE